MPKTPSEKCTEVQRKYLLELINSLTRRNVIDPPMSAEQKKLHAAMAVLEKKMEPIDNRLAVLRDENKAIAVRIDKKMRNDAAKLRKDIHFMTPEKANEAVDKFVENFGPLVE